MRRKEVEIDQLIKIIEAKTAYRCAESDLRSASFFSQYLAAKKIEITKTCDDCAFVEIIDLYRNIGDSKKYSDDTIFTAKFRLTEKMKIYTCEAPLVEDQISVIAIVASAFLQKDYLVMRHDIKEETQLLYKEFCNG